MRNPLWSNGFLFGRYRLSVFRIVFPDPNWPGPLQLRLLYFVFEHTLDIIAHDALFFGRDCAAWSKITRACGSQCLLTFVQGPGVLNCAQTMDNRNNGLVMCQGRNSLLNQMLIL